MTEDTPKQGSDLGVMPPRAPDESLTRRELEILRMIEQGLTTVEMATRLGRTKRAVQFHIGNLLSKLGARSRTELVYLARKRGLLV